MELKQIINRTSLFVKGTFGVFGCLIFLFFADMIERYTDVKLPQEELLSITVFLEVVLIWLIFKWELYRKNVSSSVKISRTIHFLLIVFVLLELLYFLVTCYL
jgi:succinate-acetate transporter protein